MRRAAVVAVMLWGGCEETRTKVPRAPEEVVKIDPPTAYQVEAAKTGAPVATPPARTADQEEAEGGIYRRLAQGASTSADIASFLRECKEQKPPITFAHLKKNADKYDGNAWRFRGKILEIGEKDGQSKMRLTLDEYGQKVIFVQAPFETEFVEDSIVDVVGVLKGSISYKSQAGWDITIPAMLAAKIAKRGELDGKKPKRAPAEDDE